MSSFLRMVNKYNAMERFTTRYGTDDVFYHSERHLLDIIRDHPELNISELADRTGVTKGAISQAVAKLERKGAARRLKEAGDDKQVLVRLTSLGQTITEHHQQVNERTVRQLGAVLEDRPQVHLDFLLEVFQWIERHLDQGLEQMRTR